MTKPDVDLMQEYVAIYRHCLENKDRLQPSAEKVMRDYVEDMEALLAHIGELEAKSETV